MTTNKQIVETAKSFIGKVKYDFGATDVENGRSDCSGFTQYVYKKHGIDIGRTTGTQWTGEGRKIKNISNLAKGDLIYFFGTYTSGYVDGVSHTGIYLGNDEFIHCCEDGVIISSLKEDYYYKNRFLGGLRKEEVIYTTALDDFENKTEESDNLNLFGDILKTVIVYGLIIIGVVMLGLSLGVHKKLLNIGG